jgi:phosphatidylcholine synthase
VAFYTALWLHQWGPIAVLGVVLGLSVLSVAPVRFVYPNRAPRGRALWLAGGLLWLISIVVLLGQYPDVSRWLVWISLVYPTLYVALSVYLDFDDRRAKRAALPRAE